MKKIQQYLRGRIEGNPVFVIFLIVIVNICGIFGQQSTDCQIPEQWEGTWFHHEHRENNVIKIFNSSINMVDNQELLGTCARKNDKGELFIFESQVGGKCTRCVFIHELHKNVLLYKETDCLEESFPKVEEFPIDEICRGVYSQPTEFYLIRYTFDAVPCPFRNEAYLFSYGVDLANKEKVCSSSRSHTESCYDDTQLVFKYDACADMQAQSKVEEIQCVGTWKSGGHDYFIATVKESQNPVKYVTGKFRCFIYDEIHDESVAKQRKINANQAVGYNVSVSMSEIATCTGLQSPTEGSLSLTLYVADKDKRIPCAFPSWFNYKDNVWTSLDNHFAMNGTLKGSEVLFKDNRRRGDPHNQGKFICRQVGMDNGEETIILAREIMGCNGKDVCIKLSKKAEGISQMNLHFKEDYFTQEEFESSCLNQTFDDTINSHNHKQYILIEEKLDPILCPFLGGYTLTGYFKDQYFSDIRAERNCSSKNPMMWHPQNIFAGYGPGQKMIQFFNFECILDQELEKEATLSVAKCLGSWKKDGMTSTVVSFSNDNNLNSPLSYCFTLTNTTGESKMHGSTKHCNDIDSTSHDSISFFMKYCGDCLEYSADNVLKQASTSASSSLLISIHMNFMLGVIVTGVAGLSLM